MALTSQEINSVLNAATKNKHGSFVYKKADGSTSFRVVQFETDPSGRVDLTSGVLGREGDQIKLWKFERMSHVVIERD